MGIKIAHEAPNQLFKHVSQRTDYDYCLVHLYVENETYRNHFKKAKQNGREIILDTSIFELGSSFDESAYIKIIEELQPTWYIIPDVIGDAIATTKKASQWCSLIRKDLPFSKPIAVLHGKTYVQIKACYEHYNYDLDVPNIAIPFHLPYYQDLIKNANRDVNNMLGRVTLISYLLADGTINVNKHHHLLGVSLPQEGLFYKNSDYSFITSIDSSSPVLHGIQNVRYFPYGLLTKNNTKLFTLIDHQYDLNAIIEGVDYNIDLFKNFFN